MFAGEDDDDDKTSGTATRYPCMPSLVALQQMRNRLHLANTGKKLMKWTAMATGRELRKLAKEMDEMYRCFREDMRNCFMVLARARYFMPSINENVLENVGRKACVRVQVSHKSVSGVKVLQMEILESDHDNYAHLGIGRGGEIVTQAKKEWRNLLKRIIVMLTERVSFVDLENANKNANKKKNVLQRVVIPRTLSTIQYILDELDEMAREEFFRIKKILANKYRDRKKKGGSIRKCVFCGKNIEKPKIEEIEGDIEAEMDMSDAEALKNIEEEYPFSMMCDECAEKYRDGQLDVNKIESEHEQAVPKKVTLPGVEEEEIVVQHTRERSIQEMLALPHKESISSVKSFKKTQDMELGTLEIEIEEITKIVRTKNDDGTVTEQKRIIKKKTERRSSPTNTESSKSNKLDAKMVGLVTMGIPYLWRDIRKAQSLNFPKPKLPVDAVQKIRLSSSLISSISLNFLSQDSIRLVNETQKAILLETEKLLQINKIQDEKDNKSNSKARLLEYDANYQHQNKSPKFKSLNNVNKGNDSEIMHSNSLEIKEISFNSDDEVSED